MHACAAGRARLPSSSSWEYLRTVPAIITSRCVWWSHELCVAYIVYKWCLINKECYGRLTYITYMVHDNSRTTLQVVENSKEKVASVPLETTFLDHLTTDTRHTHRTPRTSHR